MKKLLCLVMLLSGMVQADVLLLSDTFNTENSLDICTNLVSRQSGNVAPVTWTDNVDNDYHTQIYGNRMRMYANPGGGTILAKLDNDFAVTADDVRVEVTIKHVNTNGFSMVNLGVGADETSGNAGYSFRLDTRGATKYMKFYDNGTAMGSMDVTSVIDVLNTMVIEFSNSNTLTATFNGTPFTFSTGASYTGTTETENYVMLLWYGSPSDSLTIAEFDELSIFAPVLPFPAFDDIIGPNLIPNGDFSTLTSETPADAEKWNMSGTFGDFSGATNATATLTGWSPYYSDPNGLIVAVGTPHVIDGNGELDGTFYLDTLLNGDTVTLNSSMDYKNGLKQENILNGATIDSNATYQLAVDALDPSWNSSESTFTVALTIGSGSDVTNTANAVSGTLQQIVSTALPSSFGSPAAVSISGAALLAAQGSGPVNVIFNHVYDAVIPGFPGSVSSNDVKNIALVSQVQLDSVSLHELFEAQEGDLNKDGVVDQDDADLAQNYLNGNGGLTAADRQAALIDDGMTAAEALAALNLSGFDIDGNGSFDADDVSAVRALLPFMLIMSMSGTDADFEWNSKEFKKYDLQSSSSLTSPNWTNYSDGVVAYENILASETGTNTLSGVEVEGSMQFFRLVEKDAPSPISTITVQDASFENGVNGTASWKEVNPVWNPNLSSAYQVNSGNNLTPADGSWTLNLVTTGGITQDLGVTVNAGDTLFVTFSAGRSKTTEGGVTDCRFVVGATEYGMAAPADTTGLSYDSWQVFTQEVTIANSGNLSLRFTDESGKPWLDNISDVTRTEPQ